MKRLIKRWAAIVIAGSLCVITALASTSYTSAVTGFESSRGKNGDITVATKTSGDLAGSFTIRVSSENGVVSSGEWSRDVTDQDANGNPRFVGTLKGSVTGGGVNLNADGNLVSVNVQLSVTSGTDGFATVTEGSGSFGASAAQPGGHAAVSGTLQMTF